MSEDNKNSLPPKILSKCAEFFMKHGQYANALEMYVSSGKIAKALELAMTRDVKITDTLASRMILKKKKGDKAHNDRRAKQIVEIARVAKKQGSYHLSSKLYTQCGDKIKAMKSLLKSGDTKKIIFFAARCRNKAIYVLAANYLTSGA
eukprot:g2359.t1